MNVLVPIDGSDPSMAALDHACAEYPDATITALYVSNVAAGENRFMAGGSFAEWKATEETIAAELFERVSTRAEEADVTVETAHEFGDPIRFIIRYAEAHDIDQIVIGNHGRDGMARLALGSVAERVVRAAPMPVVVVK